MSYDLKQFEGGGPGPCVGPNCCSDSHTETEPVIHPQESFSSFFHGQERTEQSRGTVGEFRGTNDLGSAGPSNIPLTPAPVTPITPAIHSNRWPDREAEFSATRRRHDGHDDPYTASHDAMFRRPEDSSQSCHQQADSDYERQLESRYGPNPGFKIRQPSHETFHGRDMVRNREGPGAHSCRPGQSNHLRPEAMYRNPSPGYFQPQNQQVSPYKPVVQPDQPRGVYNDAEDFLNERYDRRAEGSQYPPSKQLRPESDMTTFTQFIEPDVYASRRQGLHGAPDYRSNQASSPAFASQPGGPSNDWKGRGDLEAALRGEYHTTDPKGKGKMPAKGPARLRPLETSLTNYSGTTAVNRGPKFAPAPVSSVYSSDSDSDADYGITTIPAKQADNMVNIPFDGYNRIQRNKGAPQQYLEGNGCGPARYVDVPGTGSGAWAQPKPRKKPRPIIKLGDARDFGYSNLIEEKCGCATMIDCRPEPTPLTGYFKENGLPPLEPKSKKLFGEGGWLENTASQAKPSDNSAGFRDALGTFFKKAKDMANELKTNTHARSQSQTSATYNPRVKVNALVVSLRPREQAFAMMEVEVNAVTSLSAFIHKQNLLNLMDHNKMKKIEDMWVAKGNMKPTYYRYNFRTQIDILIAHVDKFRFHGPSQNNPAVIAGILHSAKQNARSIMVRACGQPDSVIAKQIIDCQILLELIDASPEAQSAVMEVAYYFNIIVEREATIREAECIKREEHHQVLERQRQILKETPATKQAKVYKSFVDPCERVATGPYFENNGKAGVITAEEFDEAVIKAGREAEAQSFMMRKTVEAREKGIFSDSADTTLAPGADLTKLGEKDFSASKADLLTGSAADDAQTLKTAAAIPSNAAGDELPRPNGMYLDSGRNLSNPRIFDFSFNSSSPDMTSSKLRENGALLSNNHNNSSALSLPCDNNAITTPSPGRTRGNYSSSGPATNASPLADDDGFTEIPLYGVSSHGGSINNRPAVSSSLRQEYTFDDFDAAHDDAHNAVGHDSLRGRDVAPEQEAPSPNRFMKVARRIASRKNLR
ncbi:uncharacterized protein B0I36DRAFT_393511 [Microdochium trichocladiopsis]|uniref:Uncharacterized protein n=1 Tax=Microdochium trichocladiopsis TaxID=1682393 RepID=A0A9P9BL19_9PEZI|nr:uncharacterized protein B0I36DRAFT_393511 [Microdochium trichocladiopsis]KAH7021222.1 hypothetical protein B0I36DRAFT_393511 [Microdochium trichocladiopsis]